MECPVAPDLGGRKVTDDSLSVQYHASSWTQDFLPERIERPSAFLNCTFEGPKSRAPSAKFHGQLCSSQALLREEELGICWHVVVTLQTQNPCFRGINSAVVIIGPTPTSSCFVYLPNVFHCRHRRTRRRSVNVADFIVFRFCQTFLAVCPLVAFLATMAKLTFKLGGTVPFNRGSLRLSFALAFALGLIELAIFRCVVETSAQEASLSSAFANGVNIHRCRVCTAGFRLHSSTIFVEDSAKLKKL